MVRRNLILAIVFYFLLLIQTSFLVPFSIRGQIPNLVLITLFLIIFFGRLAKSRLEAFWVGFLLDIFSPYPIGISALFLFLSTLFVQRLDKDLKKDSILVFLALFLIFQLFYYSLVSGFEHFFQGSNFWIIEYAFLTQIGYNILFALIGFFVCRVIWKKN